MTTETPPEDWILIEAAKRGEMGAMSSELMRYRYTNDSTFRALCDMVAKPEKPPVDRKLLCAREAVAHSDWAIDEAACVRAIELWEEGFGK